MRLHRHISTVTDHDKTGISLHTLAQVSVSTSSGHQRNSTDSTGDTEVAEPSIGIAVCRLSSVSQFVACTVLIKLYA